MVVERHMEGKKHRKKYEQKHGLTSGINFAVMELPEDYLLQGIVAGNDINEIRIGEFKCKLCSAGPFNALQAVNAHLLSKKHLKNSTPPPEPAPAEAGKDPFEEHIWNLPDYVVVEGGNLHCKLCETKASNLELMRLHLGGAKHARKCRSTRNDEI